jgi:hypothetical protein
MTDVGRHHYAIAFRKVRGGYKVILSVQYRSRGEADIGSLRLMVHYEDTAAITLDRELVWGEVLSAVLLKR